MSKYLIFGYQIITFHSFLDVNRGGPPPMGAGAGGQMLATGLETLNINTMNPEVVNAVWKAFISVANNSGIGMTTGVPSSGPRPLSPHYNVVGSYGRSGGLSSTNPAPGNTSLYNTPNRRANSDLASQRYSLPWR